VEEVKMEEGVGEGNDNTSINNLRATFRDEVVKLKLRAKMDLGGHRLGPWSPLPPPNSENNKIIIIIFGPPIKEEQGLVPDPCSKSIPVERLKGGQPKLL
jgi:hypothetical protein